MFDQKKEIRTVKLMVDLYCRKYHSPQTPPCPDCAELICYTTMRTEKCPFGEEKPVCSECRIHCYDPEQRERIRRVMRFSGPRMILHHPVLALGHLMRKISWNSSP